MYVKKVDGENVAEFLVGRQFCQILVTPKFPSIQHQYTLETTESVVIGYWL